MSSEHAAGLVLAVSSLAWLIGACLPREPMKVFSVGLVEHLAPILGALSLAGSVFSVAMILTLQPKVRW